MRVVGVIPARYASSRLPGKPLADICGKPMVWWVYQRSIRAGVLDEIYVATDDIRVKSACMSYGIPVIMTQNTHREAANRLQEISKNIKADFYIQINGDEPLLDPQYIKSAIPETVPQDIEFGTNLVTKMYDPVEVNDPSNIKVIFDIDHNVSYLSRAPIPFPYRSIEFDYYKHIGIIGYNKKMLDFYAENPPGRFEIIEGIATLRFADYGKKLLCIEVDDSESLSVDTIMDLEHIRKVIREKLRSGELADYKAALGS